MNFIEINNKKVWFFKKKGAYWIIVKNAAGKIMEAGAGSLCRIRIIRRRRKLITQSPDFITFVSSFL
jgi:hypothetical protein